MHIELYVHTRAYAFRGSGVVFFKALPGRLSDQLERTGASERILALKNFGSFAQPAGPACVRRIELGPDGAAIEFLAPFRKPRDVCDGVMDDRRITGSQFDRLNPPVFFERHGNVEVLHRQLAFGRNFEVDRHRDDQIRLAPAPAPGKPRQRREIGIVPLRRTCIHPGHDSIDFFLRQSPLIAKL